MPFDSVGSLALNADANNLNLRQGRARAIAGTGTGNQVIVGDSIPAGYGSTVATSWPSYVSKLLATKGLTAKNGIQICNTGVAGPANGWTFNANWASLNSILGGPVRSAAFFISAPNVNTATCVTVGAGTNVTVIYEGNNSFSVTIDTVLQAAPSVPVGQFGSTTYTGLANTTHTVVITPAGTQTVIIDGCFSWNTGDYLIHNLGIGGMQTSDFSVGIYDTVNLASVLAADAIVCNLGTNDRDLLVPAATYQANYQGIITRMKAITNSITLVVPHPENQGFDFTTYDNNIYSLAAANNCLVLDMMKRWVSFLLSNQPYMFDNVHPKAAGAVDYALAQVTLQGL